MLKKQLKQSANNTLLHEDDVGILEVILIEGKDLIGMHSLPFSHQSKYLARLDDPQIAFDAYIGYWSL